MGKYWAVFRISVQQEIYWSASFLMDRARSITIILAFYAFWSALFAGRSELLGYTKSQMFTYVLGMNVLRALVFSDKTWEIIYEINTGKISSYLIRPISYIGYCLSRDAADKAIQLISSLLEIGLALFILRIPLYFPHNPAAYFAFMLAIALALILYFLMSYFVSAFAFWTAESAGPRFRFELFLEFSSGAFFPLDVLPKFLRHIFEVLPFSSLLFFPLNVFLERAAPAQVLQGLAVQAVWICFFSWAVRQVWQKGLRSYAAQGG